MKNKFGILFTIVAIGFMASNMLARPSNYMQRQKLTSLPRGVGAQFGNAVAISGNFMVVGAQFDGSTASQAGAVFVYVLEGTSWAQEARLTASDGAVADKFGTSVAISGDTIVVGAFNADAPLSNGGAAYVFVRNGLSWTQQQKLTASDGTADDQFGNAVAIDGNVIAIGANHADLPSNSESGAVYVFSRTGTVWTQTQRLSPSLDVVLGDHFGDSLAMNANTVVIGASGDDTPFTSAGAVYVFRSSGSATFVFQQKLTIADGSNGDQFGFSVAFDGTTIVGGAKEDTTVMGQTAIGAAYVFTFNGGTWSQQQKLLASDGTGFDRFGWSVAVSGSTVAIGAREDDTAAGPDTGSTYIFTRTSSIWTEKQKLLPSDTFNGDRFGVSMAFNGTRNLVVGAAEKALTNPNGQGAVYTFTDQLPTLFDYDGDRKSDVSVFRPSSGTWYLQRSQLGFFATNWGISTDKITPADFDGDGKADVAVFRPSTGTWYVFNSATNTFISQAWGLSGDLPTPADFDGDGKADITVFRPSNGTWFRLNSSNGSFIATQFGLNGDKPVAGDYDGDGNADVAVFRPSSGTWYVLNSSNQSFYAMQWGISTDTSVPADYDGDGKADIAVFRPSSGTWYVLRSSNGILITSWGLSGDLPASADYDGDGLADVAVFRPSNGTWYVTNSSSSTFYATQFGLNGDIPTENAFRY